MIIQNREFPQGGFFTGCTGRKTAGDGIDPPYVPDVIIRNDRERCRRQHFSIVCIVEIDHGCHSREEGTLPSSVMITDGGRVGIDEFIVPLDSTAERELEHRVDEFGNCGRCQRVLPHHQQRR